MADFDEATFSPEDEEQLWFELQNCIEIDCESSESIDDALRTWLDIASRMRERFHDSEDDIVTCVRALFASELYQTNKDYVRTQIIYSLLQEDDIGPLHAIASLLLHDGRRDESTFPRMVREACFPRLLDLIHERRDVDPRLHRLLLELMYEMSRVERLRSDDLGVVNDDFVHYLFRLIEGVSDDVHDPYHYPTIRVLLVLNEQYMLASTDLVTSPSTTNGPVTNRIVKCLSLFGPSYRTFGENIILLLNRETETSLQLLILKLLYLLFTTKATYEYFYTNDLRVLLDVIIRNLMDLPDEKMALRHTYLRVLYPLLAHTQLSQPPHYKQDEVVRVLRILRGSHNAHFAPADETTLRLVDRTSKVPWLPDVDLKPEGAGEAEVARKFLGISLSRSDTGSTVSVGDVATVTEKPGVQTPSRNNDGKAGEGETRDTEATRGEDVMTKIRTKKPLPAVPKHRHGTPFAQAPTVQTSTAQSNEGVKKIPPKAPPPRRWGKMKTVEHALPDPLKESATKQEA